MNLLLSKLLPAGIGLCIASVIWWYTSYESNFGGMFDQCLYSDAMVCRGSYTPALLWVGLTLIVVSVALKFAKK